ncbi:MAG: hypothetical protein ACOCQA_03405 [bacterium]
MNWLYLEIKNRYSYVYYNNNYNVFKIIPDTGDPALGYSEEEYKIAQKEVDNYCKVIAKERLMHI